MMSWGSKGKRSVRKPRTYSKPPSWSTKKPRSVPAKVRALTKKVNQIAKTDVSHIKYQQTIFQQTLGTALGTQNYTSFPLTSYASWGRIFGTDADDESGKVALLRNMNLKFCSQTNEPDNRSYSLFVVKLKKLGSSLALGTGIGTMTANQHFVMPPYQTGDVILNPLYFTTLYSKRWTFGIYPETKVQGAVTYPNVPASPGQTTRQFSRNINFGKSGLTLTSASGDWKAATFPPNVSSQIYVLIFCNDSTTDGEYATLSMNAVHSIDV